MLLLANLDKQDQQILVFSVVDLEGKEIFTVGQLTLINLTKIIKVFVNQERIHVLYITNDKSTNYRLVNIGVIQDYQLVRNYSLEQKDDEELRLDDRDMYDTVEL